MKLFFIRHGQTDWNIAGRIQGSTEIPLNETGIAQAEELSKNVLALNYKISKIYSSKQKRAMKTAQILSEATNVDYILQEGLEEICLGEWEGLNWEEVNDKYPVELEEWNKNHRYSKSHKGESYQELLDRVLAAIQHIINENNENVAIVTHGAVIMCLRCYITNTSFDDIMKFRIKNASITEIDSKLLETSLIRDFS